MSGHPFKKGDAVFYASSEGALPAIVTTIYGDGKASIDIREGIIRIDKLTKRECHVVGKKSSDGGNQENTEGDGDAPASGGGFKRPPLVSEEDIFESPTKVQRIRAGDDKGGELASGGAGLASGSAGAGLLSSSSGG